MLTQHAGASGDALYRTPVVQVQVHTCKDVKVWQSVAGCVRQKVRVRRRHEWVVCTCMQGGEHQAPHTFHTLQLGWVPGKCVHNNGHPTPTFAAALDLPTQFTPVAKGLGLQWPDANLKSRSSASQR